MSFGDGDLHVQVAQLKTENARLKQQLDKLPEIVRCRDCVHFDAYGNTFGWCALHDIDCSERRYCAWGERKEGGE